MSAEKPRTRAAPTARSVAAEVVARVMKDRAFAAAALEAELGRAAQLEPRDRALATELAYGTLRVLPWLRARLDGHAKKGTSKLDPRVFAPMAVAAYQLFFLPRIPAFAAVNECVEVVRVAKGKAVSAFANAVLRKVATEAEQGERGARREEAIVASTSPWLKDALARALGGAEAAAFLASALEPPPVCLRVEHAEARDSWLSLLRAADPSATFEAGKVSPHAILARGAGQTQSLPGFREAAWSVQEEGSQVVALAAGARAGEIVLDACAGRGNKTAILARAVGGAGGVDAADLHAPKLERLRLELARIGLAPRAVHAVDWTVGAGDVDSLYDCVLVDAPCSGVGTLRRRPEIQARRSAEDLVTLAALQCAIASRVAERVRPGGRLVYAVCSVLREEGEDVVERLLASRPELEPAPFAGEVARAIAGDAPTMRLLPATTGTDGYFVANFRRRGG